MDEASLEKADQNADGTLDIADVNELINRIIGHGSSAHKPIMGWQQLTPDTIAGKMISTAGVLTDIGTGRLWVWHVQPGDTLRLTIDHDNSINVNMRTFTIFPSDDMTQWTPTTALATGCLLRQVDSVKVYDPIIVPDGGAVMVCSGFWYENGRIGDGASAATNPYTAYKLELWTDVSRLPARRPLRVLAVGNSFTCDEVSYVPYVMKSIAPDVDLHLRILKIANGTVANWVDCLENNTPMHYYDWQPFPGRWSQPQLCVFREQMAVDDWDVMIFQQASHLPFWEEVEQPLRQLTGWLRDSVGYNGRMAWEMNHAYSDSNVVATPELAGVAGSSDQMWELNCQLARQVMASGLIDMLLPAGTAVQNARHTRLRHFTRNQLCDGYWDWTKDARGGRHLQEGIGPFVAACAVAGALLNQSPLGAQVQLSSTWRIPAANPVYSGSPNKNPTLEQIEKQKGGLGMDTDSQALGAWCADQALQTPYQLIEDTGE